MAMKKQTAQFPLIGGQDARKAPQLILAPEVTSALNLYRARTAEWTKRNGFHYLAAKYVQRGGGAANFTPAKARALGNRDGNLVMIDKTRWWEWSPLLSGFQDLTPMLTFGAVSLEHRMATHRLILNLAHGSDGVSDSIVAVDVAYGAGYACTVWQTSLGSIGYSVVNLSTGQVHNGSNWATGVRPKVVFSENHFSIFHVVENGGGTPSQLHRGRIDVTGSNGPVVASIAAALVTDLMSTSVGTPWYDVQLRSTGNVLVAYRSSVPNVRALEYDPATNAISIAAIAVVGADLAANAIGWVYNAADTGGTVRLLTATNTATGIVERQLNGATLAQTAATTILASPGDVASITGVRDNVAGDTMALWELRNADTTLTSIVEGHTTGPWTKPFMGIGCLQSKPFQIDGGDWSIVVSKPWDLQPGYFVVPFRSNDPLGPGSVDQSLLGASARILPGSGVSLPAVRNALAHVAAVSTVQHIVPCMRIYDFRSTATTLTLNRRAALAVVDWDAQLPKPVAYSRTMLAPGSVCRAWAGDVIHECGFLLAPEKMTATLIGGGVLTDGNYQYRAVWAIDDGEGRTWRSAASPPLTVTTGGGSNNVDWRVKMIFLSAYSGFKSFKDARIEIYRTKRNGTTFFRLNNTYRLVGSPQFVQTNDNLPDADLETNLPLYTDGGELFNEAPQPLIAAAVVGDRIVGIPAESRTSVVASKAMVPGQGLGFHPDLDVPIVADGDNYAVAAMENRTIVFKRQAIYILTGDWPTNVGTGSLPIAQRVAKGFGTINAASVCESQDGIWFEDPGKGMCLLTRGLDVVQNGVQNPLTLPGFPSVGVTVAEDEEQVRVWTTGAARLWDYLEKQWATWTLAVPTNITCAAVVGGIEYIGLQNGRVAFYNTASFQDEFGAGLVNYTPTMELRFDMAGKEGVQRLYRLHLLGKFADAVSLLGRFSNDYATGVEKAGLTIANAGDGTFVVEFRPDMQRGTTHQFRVRFTSATEGARFAAIAVEFGVRDGLRRLAAASRQ